MQKRKGSQARAAEFFSTCVIWGLVFFVLLQLAAYHPRTGHTAALPQTVSAAAAAAGGTEAAAAAAAVSLPTNTATSPSSRIKGVLSATKLLQLVPQSFTGEPLVVVTTTTAPYIEWTLNWSAHLTRLGAKHAVVALDSATVAALTAHGLPAVLDASQEAQAVGLLTSRSVRREYGHLRSLGYLRVGLPFQLMQQYSWQAMVLSDVDVVWLQHPSVLLQAYPAAEFMVSTDCLSVKAVVERQPEVYRCGMQPGGWNSAWNTGVVVVRNMPAAVAAMTAWRDAMAPGSANKSAEGWWIDDQLALTQLLDGDSMPFQGINEEEQPLEVSTNSSSSSSSSADSVSSTYSYRSPTILAMHRSLKTVALSPFDVAGGHATFHQRLPEVHNVTPVAVHYTFQAKFDNAGKLSRARESNYYLRDAPEPPGSRYLTYQNSVEAWLGEVDVVWKQQTGRQLVDLHKHLLAAGYQLQVFAETLAAAQVLNRTLVPPRLMCYCTQDASAWTDPLHTCAIVGSDALPPFQCTMENLINVVELERNYAHVLRTPDFLKRREVQAAVGGSTLGLRWSQEVGDTSHQQQQQQQQQEEEGSAVVPVVSPGDVYTVQLLAAMHAKSVDADLRPVLPLRVSAGDLRARLGAYGATAVLDFGLLAPGWFAGFEGGAVAGLAAGVQQMVKDLTVYVGFCCLLESEVGQKMDHAYVDYQKPVVPVLPPLAQSSQQDVAATAGLFGSAAVQWQPAPELFVRPAWCNADDLRPLNLNISRRVQHPCAYLEGEEGEAGVTTALQGGLARILQQMHQRRAS